MIGRWGLGDAAYQESSRASSSAFDRTCCKPSRVGRTMRHSHPPNQPPSFSFAMALRFAPSTMRLLQVGSEGEAERGEGNHAEDVTANYNKIVASIFV